MALDMFLRLEGINGESTDYEHAGEIDVLAWSWGMSQSGSMHARGAGIRMAGFQDLSITKWTDRSTPGLMRLLATGRHIAEGELVVRKAGKRPLEYVKLKIARVMVTSWSGGGSGGEDRFTENITLNFAEFAFTYSLQREDGSRGASLDFKWDIATNVEGGAQPRTVYRNIPPPPPVVQEPVDEPSPDVDCGPGQVLVTWPDGGRDCMPIGWDDR